MVLNNDTGVNIYLQPEEVWDFYHKEKQRVCDELVVIAENINTGYEVMITEESGTLFILVSRKNVTEHRDALVSSSDSKKTVREIYIKYLFPVYVNDIKRKDVEDYIIPDEAEEYYESLDDKSVVEIEDQIYEREDELLMAFKDFLEVVIGDYETVFEGDDEQFKDMFEDILEMIGLDYGYNIYRPMFIEADGEEVFVEYPYGEVEE